ncbi:MAG: hypothetical protein M3070_04270 [Actinomycetota bacterium]|nr:hypothetical protein [Actinomycetota bacterium]
MRLVLLTVLAIAVTAAYPATAGADVSGCGGTQPLGVLTCSTTGPAMIDANSFVGDGGSSAQYQWLGTINAATPGTLQLDYTYTGVFNTLFAKIGMRLTVRQPSCDEPHESRRDWLDPSVSDGVPQRVSVRVSCAGPVNYTITSRVATYSLGGSFIGQLAPPTLTFSAPAPG